MMKREKSKIKMKNFNAKVLEAYVVVLSTQSENKNFVVLDSFFFAFQVAVCNLASLALNMYVTSEHTYDFKKLAEVTKVIVRNLNKIIDINYYPVPEV